MGALLAKGLAAAAGDSSVVAFAAVALGAGAAAVAFVAFVSFVSFIAVPPLPLPLPLPLFDLDPPLLAVDFASSAECRPSRPDEPRSSSRETGVNPRRGARRTTSGRPQVEWGRMRQARRREGRRRRRGEEGCMGGGR